MTILRSAGVWIAAIVLVTAGATSANASVRPHAPSANASIKALPASKAGAGYTVLPGSPNVSSASAQFTVPTVSCHSSTDSEGIFPGIWVYDSTGALTQQVDLNLYCFSGQLTMIGVVCIAGSSQGCVTSLTVSPGDRIIATFSESPYHSQGQLYDLTSHASEFIYDGTPAPTDDTSVFIGDAGPRPFGVTHVPVFDHIPFSKCQVDGYYLFEYSPAGYSLKSGPFVQVKTGPLRNDGDGFSTSFVHI